MAPHEYDASQGDRDNENSVSTYRPGLAPETLPASKPARAANAGSAAGAIPTKKPF